MTGRQQGSLGGAGWRIALALVTACLLWRAAPRPAALAQTAQIVLVPGWNNIAYVGPAQPVLAALAPIQGQYDAIWTFDAPSQTWKSFNPQSPDTSDFADFAQNTAYWIHMTSGATLNVGLVGVVPNQQRRLLNGWNNVAQTGPTAAPGDALAPFDATFSVIWHWNAATQRWELYDPAAPAASDFTQLIQGQAYFVSVTSASPNPAAPTGQTCYNFQSYQPEAGEVGDALVRAAQNGLADDPAFRLPDLHTAVDGGPTTVPGAIPPTILRSIAWIESGWRQATYSVPRGSHGATITSRTCAYGLMQVLSGMQISGQPSPRQTQIGTDYVHNILAGAQILANKWNMAPAQLPVYGRRDPNIVEDWYFALWAYHCFGDVCAKYNVHNNPDDPALKWPRPVYGSPDQQNSRGAFTASDYPYQEIILGQIAYPPVSGGARMWTAIPVQLPPHGAIGFPVPKNTPEVSAHLDSGETLPVPNPAPAPAPVAAQPTASPAPRQYADGYFPPVGQ